tara:strand:- start:28901 stop:29527 length:627 start_codon:yes stop_codon:yes gene_type:complete
MNLVVEKKDYQKDGSRFHSSERAVELPLGQRFYNEFKDDELIEVGSVLENLNLLNHPVVDLGPSKSFNHIKQDALGINYTNKSVLSMSTIEHVGDFELRGNFNHIYDSIKLLQKIHSQSSRYLITYPVGYSLFQPTHYNPLDLFLAKKSSDYNMAFYIKKRGTLCAGGGKYTEPEWKLSTECDPKYFKFNYGCPFKGATILVVIYNNI